VGGVLTAWEDSVYSKANVYCASLCEAVLRVLISSHRGVEMLTRVINFTKELMAVATMVSSFYLGCPCFELGFSQMPLLARLRAPRAYIFSDYSHLELLSPHPPQFQARRTPRTQRVRTHTHTTYTAAAAQKRADRQKTAVVELVWYVAICNWEMSQFTARAQSSPAPLLQPVARLLSHPLREPRLLGAATALPAAEP